MKYFVAITIICAFVIGVHTLTEEHKKAVEKTQKECQEVSKIDDETLHNMNKGIIADDPKIRVQAFCFNKKYNFQNEKGEIQFDVIKKELLTQIKDEAEVENLIKTCAIQKESSEETALESWKCFHSHTQKEKVVV